jgi:hypothetical protein
MLLGIPGMVILLAAWFFLLQEEYVRFAIAMGVIAVALGLTFSCKYVMSNINIPSLYPGGTRVRIVRVPGESEHPVHIEFNKPNILPRIQSIKTLPLVNVYQVPLLPRFTKPLDAICPSRVPEPFTWMLEPAEQKEARLNAAEALARKLQGPNGIVFVDKPTTEPGFVDGEVWDGTSAVVVADDQWGGAGRGVIVQIVRDPALPPDMRPTLAVTAIVRAGNLRVESP